MVVVIDDRADVWGAARNLVKVVPCASPPLRLASSPFSCLPSSRLSRESTNTPLTIYPPPAPPHPGPPARPP